MNEKIDAQILTSQLKAVVRIKKLIEVIKETRSESTGMTLVLHELKQILEILKGDE